MFVVNLSAPSLLPVSLFLPLLALLYLVYAVDHSYADTSPSCFHRFRLRNKKGSGAGRAFPLAPGVMGKTFTMEGGIHTDVPAGAGQGLKVSGESTTPLTEGVPVLSHPQLISRGADMMEEMKRAVPNGSGGANGSSGAKGNVSGSTEQ